VTRLPKLSLACDSATHLILSATASTGAGGDQPFFDRLLFHAWRRSNTVRCVVADAGYDSEANHRIARLDMGVRSIIPPRAGRPTSKPPSEPLRRQMHHRFARKRDRVLYGQRWQSETVNSMIKRNLGSALRARTTVHRRNELLLRVLTHNIMLLAEG
jgi:Transposase DDE domain